MFEKQVYFMNLNYTRVLHFLTVVKYMNMNKAAKELYITQPALSFSISRLEKELGLALFYRDKNKLVLSKEAEILLPRFEQFRKAHDVLVSDASGLVRPMDNHVNISFSGSAFFFPVFHISGFLNQFGDLQVRLSYVDVKQATAMLLANQTDFALSFYPILHPLISTENIMSDPIGLVLSENHPLARQGSVTVQELETVPLHGLTVHHNFRKLCDQICQTIDIHLKYVTEDDYTAYYKRMLTPDQAGFLSTRENYEQNLRTRSNYVFLPIEHADMRRDVGISYVTSGKMQYKYKDLVEYIKAQFPRQSTYVSRISQIINQEFFEE